MAGFWGWGLRLGSGFGVPTVTLMSLLFPSSQVGGLYQPWLSDSLYQENDLTVPVTGPNQTVQSIRDYSGNGWHLVGSGTSGRVPPRGWVNQLISTDTLATQDVTVVAAEQTLSFTGTGTVTLTGASTAGPLVGTGAEDRVSLTYTPTAGTLTLTVSGSVTNAHLNYGAAFSAPYQSVGSTWLDVTEEGSGSRPFVYGNGSQGFFATLPSAQALPVTLGGLFNVEEDPRLSLFGLSSASDVSFYAHLTRSRAGSAVAEQRNGTERGIFTITSFSAELILPLSAVFENATTRRSYARGTSASNSTSVLSNNFARANLFQRVDQYSPGMFFGGYIRAGVLSEAVILEAHSILEAAING